MLLDFTENFDLKNFKTYKDIYCISQLDKLDPKKLYRLTFEGNLSFNADIPSEYIIHNKIFYKEFGNLYSILKHKIPKSVIKKAFDKYGNGSISEYEDVNTITESSVIKPSDMDSILANGINNKSLNIKGKIYFDLIDENNLSYETVSEDTNIDIRFTESFTGEEFLKNILNYNLSGYNGHVAYVIVDNYLSNLRISIENNLKLKSTLMITPKLWQQVCKDHNVIVYWFYK